MVSKNLSDSDVKQILRNMEEAGPLSNPTYTGPMTFTGWRNDKQGNSQEVTIQIKRSRPGIGKLLYVATLSASNGKRFGGHATDTPPQAVLTALGHLSYLG